MTLPQPLMTAGTVTKKLQHLQQLLIKEKEYFEALAGPIADKALRCTVLSLAQQNSQYAAELSCYLQTTGTNLVTRAKKQAAQKRQTSLHDHAMPEKGVLASCSSNERKIAMAYRRVLQETALYQGLKDMMGYQLNGILSACTQLRLLSSLTRMRHTQNIGAMA